MFELNPFEVGNPMTLGMVEEALVSDIDKMIDASGQGYVFFIKDIYALLGKYNVSYMALPDWIKQKIDEIELA